jgi:hypothetical protein
MTLPSDRETEASTGDSAEERDEAEDFREIREEGEGFWHDVLLRREAG